MEKTMEVKKESLGWKCTWEVEKYLEDIKPYKGREKEFHELYKPYETIKGEGNCALNWGIWYIWVMLCDTGLQSPTWLLNNAGASLGVGDNTTPAVATQTDLQASSNKKYNAMESGYPCHSYGAISHAPANSAEDRTVYFKSSFGESEANFAWNEWVVKQTGESGYCLNRKAVSLGTKSSGTWTLTVTLTIS